MVVKTCDNCKHFWVDAAEHPCVSCKDAVPPSNWESRL